MEPLEAEIYEEPEEKPIKRRSSILKIPKARNPFEEVDVTETCADLSMFKPVRRVSFASSNFVKPFVADPEKNTIWDTTYEEDVNHTNSTQSSQEQILNSCTKSTLFDSVGRIEIPLNVGNVTTVCEQSMEFTNVISLDDKENIPVYSVKKFSIVDYAKKMSFTGTASTSQKLNIFEDVDGNMTKMSGMEFTCQNLNPFLKSNENPLGVNNHTIQQQTDMDLTQTSICEEIEEINEKPKLDDTGMEFTCQIPTKINQITSILKRQTKDDMEFTCQIQKELSKTTVSEGFCCQISEANLKKTDEDMEFTCQVPQSNLTQVGDDMEFTCHVPQNNLTKIIHSVKSKNKVLQHNVTKSSDKMELTCQMPDYNLNKTNDRMEFTGQIQQNSLTKTDNNEFTRCQIPSNQITINNDVGESFARTQKSDVVISQRNILSNRSDVAESICHIDSKYNESKNVSSHSKANIEKSILRDKSYSDMEVDETYLSKTIDKSGTHQNLITPKSNVLVKSKVSKTTSILDTTRQKDNVTFVDNISFKTKEVDRNNMNQTNELSKTHKDTEQILEPSCHVGSTHNETENSRSFPKTIEKSILKEKSYSDMEVDETHINESSANNKMYQNLNITSQNTTKPDMSKLSDTLKQTIEEDRSNIIGKTLEKYNVEKITIFEADSNTQKKTETSSFPKTIEKSILKEKSHSQMEVDETYINKSSINNKTHQNLNITCQNTTKPDMSRLSNTFTQTIEDRANSTGDILKKCGVEKIKIFQDDSQRSETCQNVQTPLLDIANVEKPKALVNKTYSKQSDQTCDMKTAEAANCHTPKIVPKSPKTSQIPIKTNSRILSTPDISSAKKQCTRQKQNDSTSESPMIAGLKTKVTVPLPKLLTFKHELSDLRTPEASFHINLTNLSSEVDDTEHFLQCTYSKPNPRMKSMLASNDTGYGLNLEETGHVSRPDMDLEETKNLPDTSMFDISKCRTKLSNINDTYVLKKKKDVQKNDAEETTEALDEDTSLGLLAEDCFEVLPANGIQLPTKSEKEDNKIPIRRKTIDDFKVKEYPDFKIRRVSELSGLMEDIKKKNAYITNFLENFKFRPMRIPEKFTVFEESSMDTTGGPSKEDTEVSIKCPTVEEKIRKHQESCRYCWMLEKVDEDFYHFSTLFRTLDFVVELHPETDNVVKIETVDQLKTDSKPIAKYILKLFLDKLSDSHIKSAIGHNCDILSLLDYVQLTMLQLYKFQFDFMMLTDMLSIQEDFVAKYRIICVPLILSCDVLVDVNDLENLNCDEHIKIVNRIGIANEEEIKNLAKNCAKGLDFFTSFYNSIEEYLDIKIKKKSKQAAHMSTK